MKRFTVHPRAAAPEYRNEGYDVASVYQCPSQAKLRAWEYVEDLCDTVNGMGLAVSGHNAQFFSANFFFHNPDNGRLMMAVITPRHNHAYYVN